MPGPLLLASTGGRQQLPTLMPYAVSSAGTATTELITLADNELKRKGVQDPHLEVEPGQEPKFSSHSLRRLADTVARRDMSITGTSEADIDIYFGWQEKILLKAMQRHYEAMSVLSRMSKAKITSLLEDQR